MQLLVDSGSTKANWCLLNLQDEPVAHHRTAGLNPLLVPAQQLRSISGQVAKALPALPSTVHFYGSGCGDTLRQHQIRQALIPVFPGASISVAGDLFGAARATCGTAPGIACILGTGMNSGYYDGHTIVQQVPSLGFILGDEGSGSYLGKQLLRDYFYGQQPAPIAAAVAARLPGGRSALLTRTYQSEAPAAFLAGFTQLLHPHRKHPYCQRLLRTAFSRFQERILSAYPKQLPVHFVGSIAAVFEQELRNILEAHGWSVGVVRQDPMPGLVDFHRTTG